MIHTGCILGGTDTATEPKGAEMARIQISGFQCERCQHQWVPRDANQAPTVCPKCKSPYWDRPRAIAASLSKPKND